jgi:uncharacterized protein YgiM (DUF1202 family)
MSTRLRFFVPVSILSLSLALAAFGCTATSNDPESGTPEDAASTEDGVSGSIDVGSVLTATTGLNVRSKPSTSSTVLDVLQKGDEVTVLSSTPQNGFYKIQEQDGTTGWCFGKYMKDTGNNNGGSSSSSTSSSSSSSSGGGAHAAAMDRAKSAMGFSYWWGHGRWTDSGPAGHAGSCSGSCPNCSHSGSYGADCSGFVAKVWGVPSGNTDVTNDDHTYATGDFDSDTSQWHTVSQSSMKQGDALVYHSGSHGHIVLYDHGDAWGSPYVYECKGCSYGCIEGVRSISSSYHGIRRAGW